MSASHETFEWHLTPDGWVAGSEFLDFGGKTIRSSPQNRIATFVLEEHQGHALDEMQSTWAQTWVQPDTDIDSLYEKFGMHPDYVANSLRKYGR